MKNHFFQKHSFADFLQNRSLRVFCKFHSKPPMLESLFNEVAALKTCNFIKKRLKTQVFTREIRKIFKKTFFLHNTSGGCLFFLVHVWTADELKDVGEYGSHKSLYFLTLCYIITGKCLQPVFFCFFYLNVTIKHYFQEYLCRFFKRFSMKTPCLTTWMIIFFIFKLIYFKLVLIISSLKTNAVVAFPSLL